MEWYERIAYGIGCVAGGVVGLLSSANEALAKNPGVAAGLASGIGAINPNPFHSVPPKPFGMSGMETSTSAEAQDNTVPYFTDKLNQAIESAKNRISMGGGHSTAMDDLQAIIEEMEMLKDIDASDSMFKSLIEAANDIANGSLSDSALY